MTRKLLLLLILACIVIFFAFHHLSNALDLTGDVPFTTITFSGLTSPGSFVEINLNGNTIGTALADIAGRFSYTLGNYGTSGETTFIIKSQDRNNNFTRTMPVAINIMLHSDNQANNLYLSPTASFDHDVYAGLAYPKSVIDIMLNNSLFAHTTSDATGTWKYTFDKKAFAITRYSITSQWIYQNITSQTSLPITVVFFSSPNKGHHQSNNSNNVELLWVRIMAYVKVNAAILQLLLVSGSLLYFSSSSVNKKKLIAKGQSRNIIDYLINMLGLIFLAMGFAVNAILLIDVENIVTVLLVIAYPASFFLSGFLKRK